MRFLPEVGDKVVGKELKFSAGRDFWVELAHGSGRDVARVGECRQSLFFLFAVYGFKRFFGHIDLAAHLQRLRNALSRLGGSRKFFEQGAERAIRLDCKRICQPQGHGFNGFEVFGHVLARDSVPAR